MANLGFGGRAMALVVALGLLLSAATSEAQDAAAADGQPQGIELHLDSQHRAAGNPASYWYHIRRARTEAGRAAPLSGPPGTVVPKRGSAGATALPAAGIARPGFFPADVSNFGGNVVQSAQSFNIYINCGKSDSCWGKPTQFLTDVGASTFIHVTDQYVGARGNNRYTLSPNFFFINVNFSLLTIDDVTNLVHQAAQLTSGGGGLHHIFHLFIPQGMDVCSDANETGCYSPDNPSTFSFCAFHSNVSFGDTGDILFTVEPFQDIDGCAAAPPNPNGQLIDSTNSVLSHELFETITDPQGQTWFSEMSNAERGNEVGDICQGIFNQNGEEIIPSYALVRGRTYETQLEYSNKVHGCTNAP
jgi:hypothetical protein